MHIRKSILIIAACFVSVSAIAQGPTVAEETAFLALWKSHVDNTNDHPKALAACDEFRQKNPNNYFRPVCEGVAAWHLLSQNELEAARPLLEEMNTGRSDAISKAAGTMAKRWLSRIDRESVKQALKALYRKNVEFPASLEAVKELPEADRPPMVDRWKQPWAYKLTTFKSANLKSLRGQKYELQCVLLAQDSDLMKAITRPYAMKMDLKLSRMISTSPGRESAEFTTAEEKPRKLTISVGSDEDGISFPYIGRSFILLSDGDYWAILRRSR